ncbi:hypothetical protein PoB_006159800 [Plakobranchus ocellatus]|uniref:Secreted protein n=1 Tax=Plakobranchus ocellatus TaxID=259542 RepID=A0AAV4CTC2_9GAST|nr:hypothetical protein PoB_006159800 [Plakobranchus ocellatus]
MDLSVCVCACLCVSVRVCVCLCVCACLRVSDGRIKCLNHVKLIFLLAHGYKKAQRLKFKNKEDQKFRLPEGHCVLHNLPNPKRAYLIYYAVVYVCEYGTRHQWSAIRFGSHLISCYTV